MSYEHTPTPWKMKVSELACFHDTTRVSIFHLTDVADQPDQPVTIAEVWPGGNDIDIKDGRRIVACVNACEGLSTDDLQNGAIKDMADALRSAHNLFQELTTSGAFNRIAGDMHPGFIDETCDRVQEATEKVADI